MDIRNFINKKMIGTIIILFLAFLTFENRRTPLIGGAAVVNYSSVPPLFFELSGLRVIDLTRIVLIQPNRQDKSMEKEFKLFLRDDGNTYYLSMEDYVGITYALKKKDMWGDK